MEENIQAEARKYAEQVLHQELDAVAKAYIDGYNSAKGIVDDGNMPFIDLGLPSGTLWATKFIGATDEHPEGCRMVYADAKKFNMPNIEQWKELCLLPFKNVGNTLMVYGTNGNILSLPMSGYIESGVTHFSGKACCFWIIDNSEEGMDATIAIARVDGRGQFPFNMMDDLFVGSFLSVLTVKST